MAEFRIDQATPGAGITNRARHDLIAGEVITLTAITPAPGAGVSYTWEITDKVGSTATLSATTGTSVTVQPSGAIVQPCSFQVLLTANDNGTITTVERVFSVVTANLGIRIPLFAETAPIEATLAVNTPDDSTDNAVYNNRAGLGANDQNWRGWGEWAYRITTIIDAVATGSTFGLYHFAVNGPIGIIVTPTDFLDGLREAGVAGTIASVHLTQEADGTGGTTTVEIYKVDTFGNETAILTTGLAMVFGGGAKARVVTTGFADANIAATDRIGIKLTSVQTGSPEDLTVTIVMAGSTLIPPAGLPESTEVSQAMNETVLGTTFTLIGSVYLPVGTIESTDSRTMLGTDQVADTATLELRRFTGGTVLATLTATGLLQEVQPASDIVVADADWYDLYLKADVVTTNAMLLGIKLVYSLLAQGTHIQQAFNETQTGTTPLLVGSVYLRAGTLQASSRCMLGTDAGGTATLVLKRFTGGATVATWNVTGALADDQLGSVATVPADDWYDIFINGDVGGTIVLIKGVDWVVLI